MKFETNLSDRDKRVIVIVLFAGVAILFFWYMIRPAFTSLSTLDDKIEQAEEIQSQYKNKIMNLPSAESIYGRAVNDLTDSTTDFYEVMPSSGIDRLLTHYIMGFGLNPEDMNIKMPTAPVEESPYLYSVAKQEQTQRFKKKPTPTPTPATVQTAAAGSDTSESVSNPAATEVFSETLLSSYTSARNAVRSTSASGITCASITLVMNGSRDACQSLLDDITKKPSIRVTKFEWSNIDSSEVYNPETGLYERTRSDKVRLKIRLKFYMAEIADYNVSDTDPEE